MSTKWNHAKVHTSLPLNFFALLFWSQGVIGGCRIYLHITHAINNLHIQAMAYHMNSLNIQSSGRGRGGPNYFKVGDLFYKICTSLYANFRKKSHPIRPREGLKLCLDFLCNVLIQYFNFKEINEYFWNTRKKYHNNAIPHY